MNILWVSTVSDKFLFKTSRLELAEGLRRRRHTVTLMMKRNLGKKKPDKEDVIYYPTINYPTLSGLFSGIILFFYLPFIISKRKIDIVIAGGITVLFPFSLPFKILGVPLIMDIRGLPIDDKESIFFDLFLNYSKYSLDGITTITPELKEIIIKKYNIQEKKIGTWSSGVSIKNFSKPTASKKDIKALKDSKSIILLYHGSYSPTRGIENLLDSLKELDNLLKNKIMLLIVGFSSDKIQELSKYCEKIKVKNQVKFVSQVPYEEISSYISSADVGIIPLPPENKWWQVSSPLKTLEYLAMGKPIIATNIPFHQRLFEKGNCGVLLDTADPKTLAEAITYMYHNRKELDEMGKKGKEIAKKYYTWDEKALEVEKFLKSVLSS